MIYATASTYRGACFAGFVMIATSNANEGQVLDILGNTSVYNPASQDCPQVYLKMCLSAGLLEDENQFHVIHEYNSLDPFPRMVLSRQLRGLRGLEKTDAA